jgi:hypothetical protein
VSTNILILPCEEILTFYVAQLSHTGQYQKFIVQLSSFPLSGMPVQVQLYTVLPLASIFLANTTFFAVRSQVADTTTVFSYRKKFGINS